MEELTDEQRTLLDEAISEDELRLLLDRLSTNELGGSSMPTIGAVVEATGADPRTVAGLLANIRKEGFEARFNRTFGDHERRITTLEAQTPELATNSDTDERAILQDVIERERIKRASAPFYNLLAALALMGLLILAAVNLARNGAFQDQPPTMVEGYGIGNDMMVEFWSDGSHRVRLPDGSYREATPQEFAEAEGFRLSIRRQ